MADIRPDLPGGGPPSPRGGFPIATKGIDEPAEKADGKRILVNRLWPENTSREAAALSEWRADLAPSWPLKTWFGARADRFDEFCARYRAELLTRGKASELRALALEAVERRVTLVTSDPDPRYNVATALARIIGEL